MVRLFAVAASRAVLAVVCFAFFAVPSHAQPLLKSAVQVDPGNTKLTGQTFGYRLTYNCSSTSGPCLGAEVVDLLPPEVVFDSTVPASPTGDVAAIQVTNNFMGTGRTRVRFDLIDPLPAGNSGDLLINVRFPNGTTPDGTQAVNTADGINLETAPGTFTTPPVTVTAVASVQVNLEKTLTTGPANLDLPETYRLRIAVSGNAGSLRLTSVGPVVDTLPPGTVFNGATPAADCQPGCVGTTPATVTWTSPCAVPVNAGGSCDILVNVVFPSATFPSGTDVTNSFTADGTPLGEPPQSFGVDDLTHDVTTFVPDPDFNLQKNVEGGSPNPPTLNQTFSYDLILNNDGNVPLDNLVLIDTVPVELQLASVRTGAYNNLADFAAGEGVRVSYEKNTAPGVFTLWGSSPNVGTNTTLTSPPPGLGAGEFVTRVRWEYGQAQVGMAATSAAQRPRITGQIVNPDNAGGPVAFGDTISNCVSGSAVYTAGPTNVNRGPVCRNFTLSGPFVQLTPAKENLSGGGPFNPGQAVSWRLRVRSDSRSSDPVPLESLVATDLLPVNLLFGTSTFDDRGTGLPAPQVFEQIPNFADTGRTLLRWRWNAGSGSLGVDQEVWINITTTIRNGAPAGQLANDFTLEEDAPGLEQRCNPSQADALDLDEDGDMAETLCRATGTINVAGIAQLISSKTIQGTCDGGSVSTSLGTLTGGALAYRLRVQNVGTVPMQNFVLIDILPFVGDTGVRDTNPRGSQWTPLLAAPITPPSGTVLYYSTSGNPCRGEVGGPTTSCDPPNWTTVPPDPISSARSFKVEFGNRVVGPFDFLEFTFVMTTPGSVPPAAEAFNSFAYQANRADGLGSLAAEPQKVGVALGACEAASLGDFVWVDANANGVQDDGPTGRNGVNVRLFAPGPDGVPGTLDDVPLASAVTGDSPGGAPGWYRFPGLAPGSYLVCITRPPTFELTARDQGGDTLDSDADPATACSPVVTLGPDEDNPDVDFGLVATRLAALGNYVWFDRNADGVQNEPATDGANGVTVRLFVDDGDGTREPSGDDVLVAATVTADDAFGQSGYYLFESLIPGLPYFVQFVEPASATGFTAQDAGGDDTTDSDAAPGNGTTPVVTLAPDEVNPTLDAGLVSPVGTLALGDQVWLDTDNDGLFEPQDGELGIDGVRLNLYLDANGDGEPTLDEFLGTTVTATLGGFAGRYGFGNLAPGTYLVVVDPQSFTGGGALAGRVSSTGNDPAPDPDDDANGDDNGTDVGALTASLPVTLTDNGEPTAEDGNNDTNLTVDFGFVSGGIAAAPAYDYGDAPDVVTGTTAGDYNTTALDTGAVHLLGVPGAPFLGACVDADGGFNQDVAASQDDTGASGIVTGVCAGGDDEDGVAFTGPFIPGGTASFAVTAGGPAACVLDAWVDWNRNGVFGDVPDEEIASGVSVPPGPPTALNPTVPAGALPGLAYARFRCSSSGDLGPIGAADDGEVEDYLVGILGTDFGDAPASYGTQGAGAASHSVDPVAPLVLGLCLDTETDGQPDAAALGDDVAAGTSRIGNCLDDEDGVAFNSALTACQTSQVTVVASGAAVLDAWIDFNADGNFDDVGERIFTGQAVAAGSNPLSFAVPCTAVEATTYARFRLSPAGSPGPTGAVDGGEVEDYAVNVGAVDFGDAPDSYGTLLGSGGPNHRVVAGFSLGATVDTESQGQPSPAADGDGADEDGVTLPGGGVLAACTTVNVGVALTNTAGLATARLDAWIDFDGDGAFNDPRDRIATGLALAAGANSVPVNVPCDAGPAASYARFRLSSAGVAVPGGAAADGEVEDWAVTVRGLDFGDAPDPTYPTLLASNGARHLVSPTGNPTLGALVDTEANGQPNAALSGDDGNGDDEDGVTFPATLVPGAEGTVQLQAGATGGTVSCWIDFNRNGSWGDAGEQVVTDLALAANTTAGRTFPVPVGSPQGQAASRCRISSQAGLGVTGEAQDGEVEDHPAPVGVEDPRIGIAKRIVAIDRDPADRTLFTVTFEVRLENLGNVPLSEVNAPAHFAGAFPAPVTFSVVELTSADFTVSPVFDGQANIDLLAPGNTLGIGESGLVRIVLRIVSPGVRGPFTCSSPARGTSPAGVTVTDISQDGDDVDPDDDGDPTDDNEPTVILLPVSILDIPTLDTWALLALAGLLALAAMLGLRRL